MSARITAHQGFYGEIKSIISKVIKWESVFGQLLMILW